MGKTIMLPAGYDEVPVSEIPWRIAEAVSETSWMANDHIVGIYKKVNPYDMSPDELEQTVPEEELTDFDWKELNDACQKSNLPLIQKGMPVSEYRLCERAIEACNFDWMLIPYTKNTRAYHTLKSVEQSHRNALRDTASKGEVVVYDKHTCVPLSGSISSEQFRSACMTVKEFTGYAAKFNLKVNVGEKSCGQMIKLPIAQQHENAILNWLNANGHDPQNLPMPPSGKAGVKKDCRVAMCASKQLFSSVSVFDTAWDRLRKNGEIKDAKQYSPS